jgi:hypothetical protein
MSAHVWGAHASSRPGFGAPAETIFPQGSAMAPREKEKVRDDEGVIASTRVACAPRNAIAASCCLTK